MVDGVESDVGYRLDSVDTEVAYELEQGDNDVMLSMEAAFMDDSTFSVVGDMSNVMFLPETNEKQDKSAQTSLNSLEPLQDNPPFAS